MPRVSRLTSFSSACLVAVLLGACSEDDDWGRPRPPPGGGPAATGTLIFDWSIEGAKDVEACDEAGAVSFQAIIVDEGFVIGDVSAPCEDFETSVELYVDDFLSRASLLDADGVPALGRIIEDLFTIGDGQVTRILMDFPSAAVPMDPVPDAGAPEPGEPDAGPSEPSEPDAGPPVEGTPPEATPDAGVVDAGP